MTVNGQFRIEPFTVVDGGKRKRQRAPKPALPTDMLCSLERIWREKRDAFYILETMIYAIDEDGFLKKGGA